MGSFDKRNEIFLEALSRFSSLILLFAFYGFVFLLTEITVNIRAAELWGEGSVLGVYAVGLVCTGSGYLAYTLAQRCLLKEQYRKLMLFLISFMAMVGVSVLLYTSGNLAIPAGCLALLAMGFLAAAIYYYMSCALANSPATGRIIGISMFLAVLLQYGVMHSPWQGNGMVLLVLGLAVAGICLLIWRPLGDWCFENALPYEQNPPSLPREGLLAVLMVFFMTMGFAFSDECVTALDAKGELNVAAWPRLFYGLGLLLSGYLVDLNRRSHIYIITGIAFSLALLSPALLVPRLYNASMSIMYLYSGFYVMFLTTAFLDIAPRTAEPWLWAGLGRIVRSFTTALVILPAKLVMNEFGIWGVISANAVATIGVLLLCVYANEQQRTQERLKLEKENASRLAIMNETAQAKLAQAVSTAVSAVKQEAMQAEQQAAQRFNTAQATATQALLELEQARSALESSREQLQALEQAYKESPIVQAFAKAHELTPREEEVLQLILTKDGTNKELAKELMISERVYQRYLTSIYDKTGTNSKVGLILLYYGGKKK